MVNGDGPGRACSCTVARRICPGQWIAPDQASGALSLGGTGLHQASAERRGLFPSDWI